MKRLLLTLAAGAALTAGAARASADGGTSLVVEVTDTQGAPVPDAVVFYDPETPPPPSGENSYVMDQVNKALVPHLLAIPVGSRVRFPNRDNIYHQLYSLSSAKTFEIPLYKGEPPSSILFDKVGVVRLSCNIHDWMGGIILVLPTRIFARTDAKGRAQLTGLPLEGQATFAVFHERLKGAVDATRRPVALRPGTPAAVQWNLELKPERKSTEAADYQYQ
jgi:plastocyanin